MSRMNIKRYALALLLSLLPAVALAAVPAVTNTATVTATNQFTAGIENTTTTSVVVQPAPAPLVPTLTSAGLTALGLLLAGLGVVVMRRRTRRSS